MKRIIILFTFFITTLSFAQVSLVDSIFTDGIWRNYRIYVPTIYDGSTSVPLLLNLHGYGSNAFQQEFYGEFRNIADTANFIIILPDGTTDGFGFQFWNCFQADNIGVDDVEFLSNLIDSITTEYNIDANRIYSTGMSNGGFMSYTLAGELSERIAAVASVTGSITDDRLPALAPTHPIPVMEIHGTEDVTVPYYGSGSFLPIDDVIDYWVGINNCNTTPEVIEVPDIVAGDGCTATHFIYSGGTNNANVELFRINGGGHTWPGTIFIVGVTNKDINASLEIWRFFNRYRLDVLTEIENKPSSENIFIEIYPNPVQNILQLKVAEFSSIENIVVRDMTGRNIIYRNAINSNTHSFDVSNLAAGIYTIDLEINGQIFTQKLMKN